MPVLVRLFLSGGHRHELQLDADDPALAALLAAIGANATPGDALTSPLVRLVHRVNGVERALVFVRSHLIAVETEPPMLDLLPTVHSARQRWLASRAEKMGSQPVFESPAVHVIHDFLGAERDALYAYVLEHEADFVPTRVRSRAATVSDDYDFRRGLQLHDPGPWRARFLQRLESVLPDILRALDVAMPPAHRFELSVTAHGHNDYFRAHRDNSTGDLRQRTISLVYYFHAQPRPFTGGQLVLFDAAVEGENKVQGAGYRTLAPTDDTLVAFRSDSFHQVKAVRCEQGGFADGRFTITCWLRDTTVSPA